MSTSVQTAGVAGLFYPAEPEALAAGVDTSLARAAAQDLAPKAVIAPHAGHIYSGDIAGAAYRLLSKRRGEIRRVVLLGPTHRMPVQGVALSPADAWETPFGAVAVAKGARDELARQGGVTVAPEPFVNEHSLEVHLPFVQRALGDVEVLPILVGQPAPGQVSGLLDRMWGGPETAIIVSSDLSHFHDYETARAKDAETAVGIERLQPQVCEGHRACGFLIIDGLLDQARRRDLRVTALDVRNSGDTQGARDRVVGYGAFAFEYAHSARLDSAARRTLLDVAKAVVHQAALHGGRPPNVNIEGKLAPSLMAQRASFVTLTIDGKLRGCRGSILAQQSLISDVANNAFQSAYGDPRFPPLAAAELERLEFHVSILSTPRRIECAGEAELLGSLRPDIDGLIIRDGDRQSLFLPSVWEQIPDPVTFLQHLKAKAGLPANHWSAGFEAYRFGTESFGEETLA
jgi:AmmeMemoRadiSam system protein B/AmmeMemoRadiSam system protein A